MTGPGGKDSDRSGRRDILEPKLNLVAWEIARGCNLYCAHCRAAADRPQYEGELTTEECFRIVDEIREIGNPILIMTGGEPLLRDDFFEIAEYAAAKGMRVALGSNGTLITEETAARLKAVPVPRVAISLDFPNAKLHDEFRGQEGAFEAAMQGTANARKAGLGIQINSTITKLNVDHLDDMLALASEVGATAFHPFMLIPTGRGKGLADVELSPQQYEDTLNWVFDRQAELGDKMFFKPTDAPHYMRIVSQKQQQARLEGRPVPEIPASGHGGGRPGGHGGAQVISRGCLAGTGFVFISHRGRVQGCGYFDVAAGDLKEQSFGEVYLESPLFHDLRDLSKLKGKCGICEYKRICGGCRARAYEATGDYLDEEPYCIYQPSTTTAKAAE